MLPYCVPRLASPRRDYLPPTASSSPLRLALNSFLSCISIQPLQTAAKNVEEATRAEEEVLHQLERATAEMAALHAQATGQEAAAAAATELEQQVRAGGGGGIGSSSPAGRGLCRRVF